MLNQLRDKAHGITSSKGFWDSYNLIITALEKGVQLTPEQIEEVKRAFSSERLLLVVSEIGEMVEARRAGKKADWEAYDKETDGVEVNPDAFKEYIKDSPEDELADAMIRIFSMSGLEEINLQKHVSEKMRYNQSRERLHGKQF